MYEAADEQVSLVNMLSTFILSALLVVPHSACWVTDLLNMGALLIVTYSMT